MIYRGNLGGKIILVGECLGREEAAKQQAFVGFSGQELDKMLAEAGIPISDCLFCNVLSHFPPGGETSYYFRRKKEAHELRMEEFMGLFPDPIVVDGVKELYNFLKDKTPTVVVALGNLALWALTGLGVDPKSPTPTGITKWRGSVISVENFKVIPTYNPAAILNNWDNRNIMVQDLRRVKREAAFHGVRDPQWDFVVRPTFSEVMGFLEKLHNSSLLAVDIETRWKQQISCVGIAPSKQEAICIPFMSTEKLEGYWDPQEELEITLALKRLLTNPQIGCIFHNGLYDSQYFARQWGYVPNIKHDTMIMQHVAFPGLQKSLAFCASLYCDIYTYWKDDGKEWNEKLPQEQHWIYNCTDCVRTFEVFETLTEVLKSLSLEEQYEFQMALFNPVLKMMLRGIRTDTVRRGELERQLAEAAKERREWFKKVLGHSLNPRSTPQMRTLFYTDFKMQPILDKKTKKPTLNDTALETIARRQPLLRPLVEKIQESRSIRVFKSNFVDAPLDEDNRLRSSINIAGTETFRFSASKDSFGFGANLQTIPKGTED